MLNWLKYFDQSRAAEPAQVRRKILTDNLRRGSFLAILVIGIETVFIIIDLIAMATRYHDNFPYLSYLILYAIMLAINITFILLAKAKAAFLAADTSELPDLLSENAILSYMTLVMCWGSLVTLLDQELYGQTLVFMVNMIACSVVFIEDWRRMLVPFAVSSIIILVGLPFFQSNPDILIGHYANLVIFIIVAWLASRFLYHAYRRDLKSRLEIEKTNLLLEDKIEQNRQINEKLNQVNFQLRNLSLVDELTGVANRRGLRNFIDQVFYQKEIPVEHMGALMIDMDHFKQYNDSFGHMAGDQALSAIAGVLKDNAWLPLELVARWGGEEFVLISYSRTADEMNDLADRIRQKVESLADPEEGYGLAGPITVSIGISYRDVDKAADAGPIISDADMAMYSAKRAGRNKVWSYPARIKIIPVTTMEQAEVTSDLAKRIWRESYPAVFSAAQIEFMLEKFQRADQIWQDIQSSQFQYDIVRYQDEWAGYMAARPDESAKTLILSHLYIDKLYRRNHLARQLLELLADRGKSLGFLSIQVNVGKQNDQSITFYENCGFTKTGSVTTDIGSGFILDDYIMTLTWPE
jgi:diguanylate cyclase (GGDEF)-like protein